MAAASTPSGAVNDDPPGQFSDTQDSIFQDDITWLATNGITLGCNPPDNTRFCPADDVTRGQMAAFLVRALELTDDGGGDLFDDDDGSVFSGDIDRLAAAGITRGCNPPDNTQFCPDQNVTRGQMAAFLARALDLPTSDVDFFDDDDGSVFEGDINRLAEAGVTRGCDPPANESFCPDESVTREQMAAFLHRGLTSTVSVDNAPQGDVDSATESAVEMPDSADDDPTGEAAGDVDEPVSSGDNPISPGIDGGELPAATPPWESLTLAEFSEMEEVILTPSLDLSGGEGGDQLAPAGDLGGLLPWNSEGYVARNSLPSAVGWIVIQKADGSLSYCSGTLVGVNVVLTAAHCLSSGSSYWFLPGEYGVLSGHPYWRASAHYWPSTYTSLAGSAAQPAFDYGVLILQADSQGRHAGSVNGWFPIYMYGPVSTAIAANQFLDSDWRRVSIGYPLEGWFQSGCNSYGCYPWQVDATQGELFTVGGGFYIIGWGGQSSGGNSGGGVFRNIDGRWYVVTMFTGTTNETTCLDAGFSTWSACGSSPDSNRYFGNKMWGPPLLNTAEPNYGFDDFWRAVFS